MSGLMYGGGAASSSTAEKSADLGMDAAGESSFCQFFKAMPEKSKGTVRIFDRNDFYSVHGDDAAYVATHVFKTNSVIKHLGSGGSARGLPSVTLSHAAARNFLREALTAKQLRVEIWGGGGKRSQSWTIVKQASPGNLTGVEDLLFADSDIVSSPIVIALKLSVKDGVQTVGAAYADATNRVLGVAEYADNSLFSNTESLLIQLGVKECLLNVDREQTDYDLTKLRLVVDRCGCVITERRKADFNAKNVEGDVNRLVQEENAVGSLPQFDLKVAMGATAALITYLGLLSDASNFGQYKISTHDLSQYLRLDNSALGALNLFPNPSQTGAGKYMSLFGLLNRCKTAQGTRMLAQWLKQPLVNIHAIEDRQNLVEIFIQDRATLESLQSESLKYMPDLHRISKRFQRKAANLEDVIRVYQAIQRLEGLITALDSTETSDEDHATLLQESFTKPFKAHSDMLANFSAMVEATVDLNEVSHHNYVLKPDYDDRLKAIRAKLDEVRDGLDELHSKAGRDLSMDTTKKLHMENHGTYGYCFRVTRADAGAVKGKKEYLDIATVKGGLYFTSRAMKEHNEDFRQLTDQYSRASSSVIKEIIETAASYCQPLEELNVVLANLDVILSFAYVSMEAPTPYIKPRIVPSGNDDSILDIVDARHPCLEVQDDMHFIPNSTAMKPGESEFLVITGPNMGGKSTYIRQVGIVALMAQTGCFVPAAEGAVVPVFDCILARVGAGDSMLKGVSTFMAEMLETATILKTATKNSLIIIDELGRGTSTYDGFGLAWAISEWISTKIRCKTLFATHFHELTSLSSHVSHVKNLHVVAHVSQKVGGQRLDRDITLLYKVEEGVSDQSLGIHVAELANFPESVIRLAKRKVEELEDADDDAPPALAMDEATTEAGAQLIEEFMKTFNARCSELSPSATPDAIEVDDAEGNEVTVPRKKRRVDPKLKVKVLRETLSEYRDRLDANPWVARVLESF